MKLIGNNKIPEPDTIGDWLRRMGDIVTGQSGLKGLNKVRDTINHRILRRDGIEEYTLDADATEITGEKAEAFFTYKGNKGYMPMPGFLYEANLCIYDEFREGNVPPAFGQKEFYIECKGRMPEGKRIGYYRADSASYQAELINQKEIKIGFGMERMPCGQIEANAVFFRIGAIAYNLFIGFKRLSCPESWIKHTIETFRWKMVQVAGRIIKHAGNIILKLAIDIKKLMLFKGIRERAYELSLCPDG